MPALCVLAAAALVPVATWLAATAYGPTAGAWALGGGFALVALASGLAAWAMCREG